MDKNKELADEKTGTLSELASVTTDAAEDKNSNLVSVLAFESSGARFAIFVEHTEGVVDCPKLTPLPGAPVGVAGITSVRGRMTMVMNFGPDGALALKQRLILVKGDAQLGLLADRVDGVLALEPKSIKKITQSPEKPNRKAMFKWPANSYFENGGARVPIINVDRLLEE